MSTRLPLGCLVSYKTVSGRVLGVIVGTWCWNTHPNINNPGTATFHDMLRADPLTSDGTGYLVIPLGRSGFLHPFFGDTTTGVLTLVQPPERLRPGT